MQQQLAESHSHQFRHPGLEALEDGFFMVDAGWRLTYWNAAAETMLSIPRESVLGRDLWTALPFLRESTSWDMLRRAQRGKQAHRYLDLFPDRFPGFVSVHVAPLSEGGVGVHFRDATDEVKHAEQYSALLESIQSGCIAVDASWRIVYMNSVAETLLRLPPDARRSGSIWAYIPPEPSEISRCLRATMDDGVRRSLRGLRVKGRAFRGRVYDLSAFPLAGGGISILFDDVSHRVRRERKLARLASQAQEANRAKTRFFAAMSHELRTPLNAIVGYTHLLSAETYGELPDPARRAAERAGVCAEHLSRLVDDLLVLTATEMSRLSVNLAPVRLDALLESTLAPYCHQAEAKRLSLDLELPAAPPALVTDAERLRQLLGALLTNAIKYTSRGGIRVVVEVQEGSVAISVCDTGCGVDPRDRERIFAPFEQLADPARSNPLVHGSGLGLTVARQLATLMGGTLRLVETSSAGSRFTVRLPLAEPPAHVTLPARTPAPPS